MSETFDDALGGAAEGKKAKPTKQKQSAKPAKKTKEKRKPFSFTFPDSFTEKVRGAAWYERRSMSDIAEEALRDWMERREAEIRKETGNEDFTFDRRDSGDIRVGRTPGK